MKDLINISQKYINNSCYPAVLSLFLVTNMKYVKTLTNDVYIVISSLKKYTITMNLMLN